MNRKLASAALAALAAAGLVTLGALGPTGADPIAATDVPDSRLGVGVLQLDLSGGDATTMLSFHDLLPGNSGQQLFWVAANNRDSSMPGTLSVAFDRLIDSAGACDVSVDKAQAEIASGVGGCSVAGDHVTGTPSQGNLSRKLAVDLRYVPAADASECAVGSGKSLLASGDQPGNLLAASGQPASTLLDQDDRTPLLLAPGHGACIEAVANWPEVDTAERTPDSQHPSDNAAQGDSFTVRVRFVLTQVES